MSSARWQRVRHGTYLRAAAPAAVRFRRLPRLGFRVLVSLAVLLGCRPAAEQPPPELPEGTQPGERAPALQGTRADGARFAFEQGGRTGTVVVFYRGLHCGLCRERLRELQAHLPAYERAGATVLAATGEPAAEVRRTVDELGLSFPVVSVDSAVLARWGVIDADKALPLPGSYLLDAHGVVLYRHIGRNAADRASDLELLAVLQQVQRE